MTATEAGTPTGGPARALVRRTFLDARTRTVVFAYVFAVYAWLQAAGYRTAHPTPSDRLTFAHLFAGNDAIRLFYGYPYDVLTVGGYSAWRVGGTLSIAAAAFGVLATVRAMRAEEDAGRSELVLAGVAGRRTAFLSALAAIGAGTLLLWLAEFAGFLLGGLPAGGSAYLSLGTASVIPVFVGIGAVACQLAPTRRVATALGSAAVALFWILRVLSDTMTGEAWIRWLTPLGWAEETRPFAGARPAVLLLPLLATVPLLVWAARLAASRDVGTGVLPSRDSAAASYRLLSSPTGLALRMEGGVLAVWLAATAALAGILGMVAASVSGAGIPENLQRDLARLGSGSVVTPTGYLSFVFVVFIFAICLFTCSQVGAAREEESEQRLETVLSGPAGRYRWLGGRLMLAALAAVTLSAATGLLMWAGASSQGVGVPLPRMLEAGANCLPSSLLFLGLSALAYAAAPRASSAISYTLVGLSFLWYLVGSLLGVPSWLVDVTPFRHIGLVPAQSFRVGAAVVMVAVGLGSAGVALGLFRRRDLLGA